MSPLVAIGSCQSGGAAEPVGTLTVGTDLVLVRIRNCLAAASELGYRVTFVALGTVGASGGVSVTGTVSEADGDRVGVFLLTASNNATASIPSTELIGC